MSVQPLMQEGARPAGNGQGVKWLAVLPPLLFLTAALLRGPLPDVTPGNSRGDDWLTYQKRAESILQDWTMPEVGPYHGPRGFLYCYALAGAFALLGHHAARIYVLQGFLLGCSVSVLWIAVQKRTLPLLLSLLLLAYLDAYRGFTFRLLSENLLIPLLAASILVLFRTLEKPRPWLSTLAGAFLGACILTRPPLGLALPAVAWLLWRERRCWLPFTLACVAVCLFLPLRDAWATGSPSLAFLTSEGAVEIHGPVLPFYLRRLLFIAGFTRAVSPAFTSLRPHWLLIWIGAGLWLRSGRREPWQVASLLVVLAYLAPVFLLAPFTYGVRMVAPAFFVALPLAVCGWEQVREHSGSSGRLRRPDAVPQSAPRCRR